MRFHDAAVNAVALLKTAASSPPAPTLTSRSGRRASRRPTGCSTAIPARSSILPSRPTARRWPRPRGITRVRLWPLDGGAPRVLEGHEQNVNGVAFSPDGRQLISAGYDATLRIWQSTAAAPIVRNAAAAAQLGGSRARRRDRHRRRRRQRVLPVARRRNARRGRGRRRRRSSQLAISSDGNAGCRRRHPRFGRDHRPQGAQAADARWSAPGCRCGRSAFLPDSRTLLTGGTDRMIRRWNAINGEPIGSSRWPARPKIRSPPMPAIMARRCSAPASPATR